MNKHNDNIDNVRATAASFVSARLAGLALADYPGKLPADADAAYACQDAAIALWPASPRFPGKGNICRSSIS